MANKSNFVLSNVLLFKMFFLSFSSESSYSVKFDSTHQLTEAFFFVNIKHLILKKSLNLIIDLHIKCTGLQLHPVVRKKYCITFLTNCSLTTTFGFPEPASESLLHMLSHICRIIQLFYLLLCFEEYIQQRRQCVICRENLPLLRSVSFNVSR